MRSLIFVFLLLFFSSAYSECAVQVGVFAKSSSLASPVSALQNAGFALVQQPFRSASGRSLVRLLVGPYPSCSDASRSLPSLNDLGFPGFVRVLEGEYSPLPTGSPGMADSSLAVYETVDLFLERVKAGDRFLYAALFGYRNYMHDHCSRVVTLDEISAFVLTESFASLLDVVTNHPDDDSLYYTTLFSIECPVK